MKHIQKNDVFISHSSKDKSIAHKLCNELENSNLKCWIAPRNVDSGHFAESIMSGIENSRALILIVSSNSIQSEHVLREIDNAIKNKLIIIPIKIEEVTLTSSIEYYISTIHHFNLLAPYSKSDIRIFCQVVKSALNEENNSLEEIIIKVKNKNKQKRTNILLIFITLILAVSIVFSFDEPRDELKLIYYKYTSQPENINKFSLVENLSQYSLMPNPTYEEWNAFSNKNNDNKLYYNKFIQLKNEIEMESLFHSSYRSSSYTKKTTFIKNGIKKKESSYSVGSKNKGLLLDLISLNENSQNSLIEYYIGILELNLGSKNTKKLINSLQDLKIKGYLDYAYDLEQIATSIKNKKLSSINKNNALLNPQYYLESELYEKLGLNLLKSMKYTPVSYDLIITKKNISDIEKINLAEDFLGKDKTLNGHIIKSVYVNLFSDETKDKILRLLKQYPIDYKSKIYLLTLMSLNKHIYYKELEKILLNNKDYMNKSRIKGLQSNLLKIKDKKQDVSILFDFFLKNDEDFPDDIRIIRSTGQILDKKDECKNINNIYNLSFLMYMNNLHKIEKTQPIIFKDRLKYFYMNHNSTYDVCAKNNIDISVDIKEFNFSKIENGEVILQEFENYKDDIRRKSKLNLLTDHENEKIIEIIDSVKLCLSDNSKCQKLIKSIPKIKYFFDDFKKETFDDKESPLILTYFLESSYEIYTKNEDDILIGKIDVKSLSEAIMTSFLNKLKKTNNLDYHSCYFIYAYEEIYEIFLQEELGNSFSLDIFIGKTYKKSCIAHKLSYLEIRDFVVYRIKQTVFSSFVKNITLSTRLDTLKNMESKYDLKILNLLSPYFYEDYSNDQIQNIIEIYGNDFNKSLVEGMILFYLLGIGMDEEKAIDDSKYIMLRNFINLKEGEYRYGFNLNNILKKRLGKINLMSFSKENAFNDNFLSYGYGYSFSSAELIVKIVGNINNFLLIGRMENLVNYHDINKIDKKHIIEHLKSNAPSAEIALLLKKFILTNTGKNEKWAFDEAIKVYKTLSLRKVEHLKDLREVLLRLQDVYIENNSYSKLISIVKNTEELFNSKDLKQEAHYLSYSYFNMGIAYLYKNKENKANENLINSLNSFEKLLEFHPDNSMFYNDLFRINLFMGKSFNKKIEKIYKEKFSNHKEKFIYYDAYKLLSSIIQGEKYSIESWISKYEKNIIENMHIKPIEIWIEKKENSLVKEKLKEFLVILKEKKRNDAKNKLEKSTQFRNAS